MGKKNLTKSNQQKQSLEQYYNASRGEWSRTQLEAVADQLGLSRQQVYKWLWDKKKAEKKQSSQKDLEKQEKPIETHEFYCNRFCIRTPRNLRQATQFRVDPSVSAWAIDALKKQGWQLVLEYSNQLDNQSDSGQMIGNMMPVKSPLLKQNQLIQFEEHHIYKLHPFQIVPEGLEDLPFMHPKNAGEVYVKQEEPEDDNMSCLSMERYMQGKQRDKSEAKEKFGTIHLKFDAGQSDKGSSDEIFESKL